LIAPTLATGREKVYFARWMDGQAEELYLKEMTYGEINVEKN
jgi:hypothetical protein